MRMFMTSLTLLYLFAVPAVAQEPLRVFAAASLKTVLEEAGQVWGAPVVFSFAGSGALARQIDAGAPVDVVVLASRQWSDWLAEQGALVDGTAADVASNTLVMVGPNGAADLPDPLTADALSQRLGVEGRLAVGDIRSVPAGIYGVQALTALGLWEVAEPRLAQADNVRNALAFVALGEAPLGIVYATDALAEPRVRVVARFGAGTHDPIVYPAAVVKDAVPQAADFIAFLLSETGQAVFRDNGFGAAKGVE
jgi:molybdate transport system substrate-binding protein